MILVEETTVPEAALPVEAFKDHLQLGTSFADGDVQDGVLESYLRAAMGAVEGRTGKAMLTRSFSWTVQAWRDLGSVGLPVAPVSAVTEFKIIDRLGAETVIASEAYGLREDAHRPRLVAVAMTLPTIPVGGAAKITFDAGYGPAWSDQPVDLAQAVMLLAAHFYETRDPGGSEGMSALVLSLIERFRNVRTFGGGLV